MTWGLSFRFVILRVMCPGDGKAAVAAEEKRLFLWSRAQDLLPGKSWWNHGEIQLLSHQLHEFSHIIVPIFHGPLQEIPYNSWFFMNIWYVWSGMGLQEAPKDATNCRVEPNRERMKSTVPSNMEILWKWYEFVVQKLDSPDLTCFNHITLWIYNHNKWGSRAARIRHGNCVVGWR